MFQLSSAKIQQRVSQKSGTPSQKLISIKNFFYDFTYFKPKFRWIQHFHALVVLQQFADEVGRGPDVEREVGIVLGGGYLLLRVVQWQRAQVVGRLTVGTHHHMLQWRRLVGQHAVVLAEEPLGREVGRHHKRLVGHLHRQHTVQ